MWQDQKGQARGSRVQTKIPFFGGLSVARGVMFFFGFSFFLVLLFIIAFYEY
jgi:hypothetical protein